LHTVKATSMPQRVCSWPSHLLLWLQLVLLLCQFQKQHQRCPPWRMWRNQCLGVDNELLEHVVLCGASSYAREHVLILREHTPHHWFASSLHLLHLFIAVAWIFLNIDWSRTFHGLWPVCSQLAVVSFNFQVAYATVKTSYPVLLLTFPLRRVRQMSSQWELLQMDCKRNTKLIPSMFHSLLCWMQNVQF
jgi:hypothetical protein